MKFEFQSQDEEEGTFVCHQFESDMWYGALDQFVKFLRGSGYTVGNDSVGINLGGEVQHMFIEDNQYYNITFFDSKEE